MAKHYSGDLAQIRRLIEVIETVDPTKFDMSTWSTCAAGHAAQSGRFAGLLRWNYADDGNGLHGQFAMAKVLGMGIDHATSLFGPFLGDWETRPSVCRESITPAMFIAEVHARYPLLTAKQDAERELVA